MSFCALLMYTEDMQSQQRAENGVKEIVLGYVGDEPIKEEESQNVSDLASAIDGNVIATNPSDLPDDLRAIWLADQHFKKTGELRSSDEFMPLKVVE